MDDFSRFISAVGDLLPFISVYFKQLGLTSTETGFIFGIMPFISFFVRPIFGAIADKTKRYKLVMVMCMVLTGLCYCLLLVLPSHLSDKSKFKGIEIQMHCGKSGSYIQYCQEVDLGRNSTSSSQQQFCDTAYMTSLKHLSTIGHPAYCEFLCKLSSTLVTNTTLCLTSDIYTFKEDHCTQLGNITTDWEILLTTDSANLIENEMFVGNSTDFDQICRHYPLTNICQNNVEYVNVSCTSEVLFNCVLLCNEIISEECFSAFGLSKTFWIVFVTFLFCNIFYSPILSLIDAIAYDMLGDKRRLWGRQRTWGTVGYLSFALTSTFIMDTLSKSNQQINYSISFYIFAALCLSSAFVTHFVRISENLHCHNMFKNLKELFKYPEIATFFLVVLIFGMLNSVVEIFLFWFLKDLGSSQITLGLCIVFNGVPGIAMLYFAGPIMKRVGEIFCLYVAAAAYSVQFFSYSFLVNPWHVLPVELLHSLTYALFYAAASAYGSKITPHGMSGTVQGLIGGLYFGFGMFFKYVFCRAL